MAVQLAIFLGVGSLLLYIGILNIRQVRHALRRGTIWGETNSWKNVFGEFAELENFDRKKSPIFFWLNFGSSVFAAIVLPILGVGLIGFGIFLVAENWL